MLRGGIADLEARRQIVKGMGSEIYRLKRMLRDEPRLCAYTMPNLTYVQFEDWIAERLEEVSAGTLKRKVTQLWTLLKEACRRLGLPNSPLDHIKNPKVHDERVARFVRGEEKRLFAELRKCENPCVFPAAQFALETAVRRSELLALAWSNYDASRGTIFLPDSKNGRGRTAPLTRKAQAIVESLQRDTRGKAIFAVTAETVKRARDRAGMLHWRWHDFRHEAISRLFDAGCGGKRPIRILRPNPESQVGRFGHGQSCGTC